MEIILVFISQKLKKIHHKREKVEAMKSIALLVMVTALMSGIMSIPTVAGARDVDFLQLAIPDDAEFIKIPAGNGVTGWDVCAVKIGNKPGVAFMMEFEKPFDTSQLVAIASTGKKELSSSHNNKVAFLEFDLREGEVEIGPKGNTRKFLVEAKGAITLKK